MTDHPLTKAFRSLLADSDERARAAKASARAIIAEHEAQEADPMTTKTPLPGLQPGRIVHYQRRDDPTDPKNPITFPPLAAFVIAVHEGRRTVDLLVMGSGTREDLAKGKGLLRFRGAVRYHEDAGDEARWWIWPPRES